MSIPRISEHYENLVTIWNAFITTNTQENEFVKGNVYSYEDFTIYAASQVKYLYLDCSLYTGQNFVVFPPAFSSSSGPVTIEFFADPTVVAPGTELGVSNRRGTSLNVNTAKLYNVDDITGTNITDEGTRFTGRVIPATGTAPANSSGSVSSGALPFELNTAVNYLIKITNLDGAGVYIQTDFSWMEGD